MAVTAPSTPYRHMLETLHGLGRAFEARRIAGVREEPRLWEQDFGNFQDVDKMWQQRRRRQRARRHVPQMQQPRGRALGVRGGGCAEHHHVDHRHVRAQPARARRGGAGAVRPDDAGGQAPAERRHVPHRALGFEGLANLSNDGALVMQTGAGGRYSLLVHHSVEELRVFGLTDDMIED
uniref:Uncharacterized protein n=1 Tax=Oryza glumipatula TaxID=40148 RepID=A0A0E0B8R0_9ORYZ